jgi:hypothetical protein
MATQIERKKFMMQNWDKYNQLYKVDLAGHWPKVLELFSPVEPRYDGEYVAPYTKEAEFWRECYEEYCSLIEWRYVKREGRCL